MKAGIEWCAALCDSFSLVLRVFFNSPTQFPPIKQDWVMCCSFVIPFFVFKSIQQSYPFPPIKQGLSVLLFVIPFFEFGLKSIFSPTHSTYKAGIEWCAAFCDYFEFV
jgi:hypothetical protein